MNMKLKSLLSILVLAVMLLASPAVAQVTAGGTVFDLEGSALAYEKLSAITSSTGFTSTYTSHATYGAPRAALITIETAAIRFCIDGTTATVTSGTGACHLMNAGDSYVIRGTGNISRFRAINAAAGNGAEIHVTYFY